MGRLPQCTAGAILGPTETPVDERPNRLSRIETIWTLVRQAQGSETPFEAASRLAAEKVLMQYQEAIHAYFFGALRDPEAAWDLELPLDAEHAGMRQAVGAEQDSAPLAPVLAPPTDFSGQSGSVRVKTAGREDGTNDRVRVVATPGVDTKKEPLTMGVRGSKRRGDWIRTSDL
jgi:hypothetical protein